MNMEAAQDSRARSVLPEPKPRRGPTRAVNRRMPGSNIEPRSSMLDRMCVRTHRRDGNNFDFPLDLRLLRQLWLWFRRSYGKRPAFPIAGMSPNLLAQLGKISGSLSGHRIQSQRCIDAAQRACISE